MNQFEKTIGALGLHSECQQATKADNVIGPDTYIPEVFDVIGNDPIDIAFRQMRAALQSQADAHVPYPVKQVGQVDDADTTSQASQDAFDFKDSGNGSGWAVNDTSAASWDLNATRGADDFGAPSAWGTEEVVSLFLCFHQRPGPCSHW